MMNNPQICDDPSYNNLSRRFRRWEKRVSSSIKMYAHGIFYKILFMLGIGRWYQKMICRLGLYKKFPDGRCMWCGNIH